MRCDRNKWPRITWWTVQTIIFHSNGSIHSFELFITLLLHITRQMHCHDNFFFRRSNCQLNGVAAAQYYYSHISYKCVWLQTSESIGFDCKKRRNPMLVERADHWTWTVCVSNTFFTLKLLSLVDMLFFFHHRYCLCVFFARGSLRFVNYKNKWTTQFSMSDHHCEGFTMESISVNCNTWNAFS